MGPEVVYVVVDGMGTEAFELATSSGRAPALAFIKDNASYVRDSVAVFPTITPAATASLVTGATPAQHRIPGMCWYDRDAQRFVNYGQSPRAAVLEGLGRVITDILVNLNSHHLSPDVQTIHESLDKLGFATASINYMLFRGPYLHGVDAPKVADLLFGDALPERLPGPKEHYFADVITGPSDACAKSLSGRGLEARLPASDAYASCVTRELLERDAAHMILFYLHENDHVSHRRGPASQVDNLERADAHIANVLDAFGSWEETLSKVGFVVTADHSQSPIADDEDHVLDVNEILGDFSRVEAGGTGEAGRREEFGDRDVAAAGNGRVGFVYLNEDRRGTLLHPVANTLASTRGIDQVMWRDEDWYVVRSTRGLLRFKEADGDGVVDERDNKWAVEGDLDVVSGVIEESRIRTSEYPLAFFRIKSAIDLDRMGDIVFTNELGYETKDLAGADHRGGGDHASLHVQDSLVPFVSTLDDPPLRPSTVDVCPHIVRHFERLR
jgi:hypothetical protein